MSHRVIIHCKALPLISFGGSCPTRRNSHCRIQRPNKDRRCSAFQGCSERSYVSGLGEANKCGHQLGRGQPCHDFALPREHPSDYRRSDDHALSGSATMGTQHLHHNVDAYRLDRCIALGARHVGASSNNRWPARGLNQEKILGEVLDV